MNKQTFIGLLTILMLFAVLLCQIYDLFLVKQLTANANLVSSKQSVAAFEETSNQRLAKSPLTSYQTEYKSLDRQYQLAKLRHRLLIEQEAIIRLQKKITALALAGTGEANASLDADAVKNTSSKTTNATDNSYRLMYIDLRGNKWIATLNKGGRFYEITENISLPDGTKILAVNQEGVTIDQPAAGKILLTFSGNFPIFEHPMQPAAAKNNNELTKESLAEAKDEDLMLSTEQVKQMVAKVKNELNLKPSVALKKEVKATAAETAVENIKESIKEAIKEMPAKTEEIQLTPRQAETLAQVKTLIGEKKPAEYSAAEKKLLATTDQFYTIQLMGTADKEDIVNFVNNHHLQDKASYFHTFYLNQDWYILVFGQYATYAQAIQAMNGLPENLQRLKPWVRTIASVQNAIQLGR